jgi:hypothetical protein
MKFSEFNKCFQTSNFKGSCFFAIIFPKKNFFQIMGFVRKNSFFLSKPGILKKKSECNKFLFEILKQINN